MDTAIGRRRRRRRRYETTTSSLLLQLLRLRLRDQKVLFLLVVCNALAAWLHPVGAFMPGVGSHQRTHGRRRRHNYPSRNEFVPRHNGVDLLREVCCSHHSKRNSQRYRRGGAALAASSSISPPHRQQRSSTATSKTASHRSWTTRRRQPRSPSFPFSTTGRRRRRGRDTVKYTIRQLFKRAKDLERKGQWRKAASILHDILQLNPSDAYSHLALARLEARRAPHTGKAEQAFVNGTMACPDSIHLWQAWAVHEQGAGNVDRARELFDRALQLDPYNPYVCHAYGLMERKRGNAVAALRLWGKALKKRSTAALVCSMGELLIAKKELERARDLYAKHVHFVNSERQKTEVYLALAWLEERYFGDLDRAEEVIRLALASSPTSTVAQVAWARLEGRKNRRYERNEAKTATVRRLASACVGDENIGPDERPSDGRVYNAWASIEVKAKRFGAARKILRKGIERYPKDHSLLQGAGKVEERMGNFTGARDLYSESLRVQPSAPSLVAYALLDLQHPESGTRNVTRAIRLFEEALLVDSRHGPTYNAYARTIFQHMGDVDGARKIFQRGLRASCPDAGSIYHGYAMLELSLGNVDRARSLLLEGRHVAKRQDVGTDYPHRERTVFLIHTLGMLELNRNHPSDALEVFLDGIQRYGNSSQLLLGAALCEASLGNQDRARTLFEASVLSDEKHAQAWQAWGVMEMRAGNMKTARTLFECGIRSAPRHGALWQAFATMESRLGNIEGARKLFESGIRHCPWHIPSYQSWSFMELRESNFTAAKSLISRALTRDKRNGDGWLIAAEIEERLDNSGLANLLLRRGIECAPTKPELYRALGDSMVRKGKIEEAREIYENGIEVDPRHAPLYHSLAELEARVFNVEALAKLNKRTAEIFNSNALEPPASSSEVFGARIRARRSQRIPKGVAALAQRIVEEDDLVNERLLIEDDLAASMDEMGSSLLEDGLVGRLLTVEDQRSV